MKQIILALAVLVSGATASAECTRMCDPAKSKPCGKSCISKDFKCTKPVTTACVGKKVSLKLGDAASTLAALGL